MKVIITMAIVLIFSHWTTAQTGRFPQIRERVSNVRLNQIAKQMNLEKERQEELRPIYLKYEREKQELMDGRILREMRISPDSLTDEQAEQLFFLQMEKAKNMISLREKYFREFQTVLSPKEIIQFHRIEKAVTRKMMQQIRQRFKNFNSR
ncbi:MAG: hypothetical protein ACOC13_02520 [Tangfeifania sp.]